MTLRFAERLLSLVRADAHGVLSRLEERLGSRLLNRTTRRLSLTEAGAALYDGAAGALQQLTAAESAVLELAGEPRGRLRITAPVYFGAAFLVPMFRDFQAAWPHIELDLDLDNRLVDLVEERFDVGIRISRLLSSSLIARRLGESPLVTVASPGYRARNGVPETPQQLRNHCCLTYTLVPVPNEWRYRGPDGGLEGVIVDGRMRCNSDEGLKAAALHGLGIVQFPEIFVREELAAGELITVLDDFAPPPDSIYAVFPSRENLAPKVRVFVDHVATALKSAL